MPVSPELGTGLSLLPTSMLMFALTWVCVGLVHAVRITVISYVKRPCCVLKIIFFLIKELCLLQSFYPPLPQWFPKPVRKSYDSMVPFKSKHSTAFSFSACWPVAGLCVNHYLWQEEESLMRAEATVTCGYEPKSLGVTLILWTFNKATLVYPPSDLCLV